MFLVFIAHVLKLRKLCLFSYFRLLLVVTLAALMLQPDGNLRFPLLSPVSSIHLENKSV